jgi:hypothetical protein
MAVIHGALTTSTVIVGALTSSTCDPRGADHLDVVIHGA